MRLGPDLKTFTVGKWESAPPLNLYRPFISQPPNNTYISKGPVGIMPYPGLHVEDGALLLVCLAIREKNIQSMAPLCLFCLKFTLTPSTR